MSMLLPAGADAHLPRDPSIAMAITIDDLPGTGESTDEWPKSRILDTLVEVLQRHSIPMPVGFFNGANMDGKAATNDALANWIGAGFVLGNHTFSHVSAGRVPASEFERDIERNQALISEREPQQHTGRYFRYPYLERGVASDERKIREYLRERHYRIADVSVDFEDWAFSDAYVRCTDKGDLPALAALRESYLTYALAELWWSQDVSTRLVGRPVAQVLLVHANMMTAQLLDALLTAYERAGVHFIPLEEALRDGVYARSQTAQHGDKTLIGALVRLRRAHLRQYVPVPEPLLNAMCR